MGISQTLTAVVDTYNLPTQTLGSWVKKYREAQASTTEDTDIKAESTRLKKQVDDLMMENLF